MGSEWFLARMEPKSCAVSDEFMITLRVCVPLDSHYLLSFEVVSRLVVRARSLRMAAALHVERLVPKLLCGGDDDAGGQLPGRAVPRAPVGRHPQRGLYRVLRPVRRRALLRQSTGMEKYSVAAYVCTE